MGPSLGDQVMDKIPQVAGLYHRLVLVVAPSGTGKTACLQETAHRLRAPLMNLNLTLSQRLLSLTPRQRVLQLSQVAEAIVREADSETVLLDNIELLFEPSLKQDPLRLLQGISRNRTIVASWNGTVIEGYLTYAEPGHPEYRRYLAQGLTVVHS